MPCKLKPFLLELLGAALASVFLVSLLFWPSFGRDALIYAGDYTGSDLLDLNLPLRYLAAQAVQNGELPLWTEKLGCGFPLLAEGQAGVFYPTTIPLFSLFSLTWAANWSIILSLAWAAWGGYLWARLQGLSRPASALTALIIGASPNLVFRLKHLNLIQVASWLPLSLAATYLIVDYFSRSRLPLASDRQRPQPWRWQVGALLLTLAWTMQILAGHPHMTYLCGLTVLIYAGALACGPLILSLWRQGRKVSYTWLLSLGATLLGCALLSVAWGALQLWPTWELAQLSIRGAPSTWEGLQAYPFSWCHLYLFLTPFYYENPARLVAEGQNILFTGIFWESMPYCGLLTLFLLPLAWAPKGKGAPWPAAATALILFWLALGPQAGLYWLPWKLCPGFDLFRFPARFLVPFGVVLALVAGYGLHNLDLWVKRHWGPKWQRSGQVLILSLVALNFYWTTSSYVAYLPSQYLNAPLSATLAAPSSRLSTPNMGYYWQAWIQKEGWQRALASVGAFNSALAPNSSALWGVTNESDRTIFEGGMGLLDYAQAQFLLAQLRLQDCNLGLSQSTLSPSAQRLYRLLEVSHLLSFETWQDPLGQELPLLQQIEVEDLPLPLKLYRLQDPKGRAYLVRHSSLAIKPPYLAQFLEEHGSRLDKEDLCIIHPQDLEGRLVVPPVPPNLEATAPKLNRQSQIVANSPTRLELQLHTEREALLYFPENAYPAWEARLDGQPWPLYRANFAFMAAIVPAGEHRLILEFVPHTFYRGLACTIVAALISIFLVGLGYYRYRRLNP